MEIKEIFKKLMPGNRANTPAAEDKIQKRHFHAAKIDRFTASWFASLTSINNELKGDLDRLRWRSRDLVKNNDYAHKFQKMLVTNVVGPAGFILQCKATDTSGNPDKLDNDAIEIAYAEWSKKGICEIGGRLSFSGLCRAVISGMAPDGEYLVRMVRGSAARNSFGFAIQHIDLDRLDTTFNQAASTNRNAVVMGVEMDKYTRPVAYHILTSHPSDNSAQRNRERVDAADILHGYVPEHAEQVRGVPMMAAGILSLHHLGKFEESALLAARKGADTLGFFVSPDGTNAGLADEGTEEEPITVSVPGSYDTLPEGYDFKPYESKYPDAMMAAFIKSYLRKIAAAFNVTYNGLANDLENVNFSSIRAGVIEERDQWMTLQAWFIESFLTPIYEAWLQSALLKNAIKLPSGSPLPASKLEKFKAHRWQGRRWQWVDPAKDIDAARDSVKSGVLSPQMIAAQQGVDIEQVLDDIKIFTKMAEGTFVSYSDAPQSQPKQPAQQSD